jgi:hypothetical protein
LEEFRWCPLLEGVIVADESFVFGILQTWVFSFYFRHVKLQLSSCATIKFHSLIISVDLSDFLVVTVEINWFLIIFLKSKQKSVLSKLNFFFEGNVTIL